MSGWCANCGKPATYVWKMDGGGHELTCDRCRPATGREPTPYTPGTEPDAVKAPVAGQPLTVTQAAQGENVSEKTILRLCRSGELGEGAWKHGTHWRIDPAALRELRAKGSQPRAARAKHPRSTSRRSSASATSAVAWPDEGND